MLYLVARGMIVVLTAVGDVEVVVCLSTPPASRRRAILGSTCLAPPRPSSPATRPRCAVAEETAILCLTHSLELAVQPGHFQDCGRHQKA
jgi:hypothetical protein